MGRVILSNLYKEYGDNRGRKVVAVDHIDLEIEDREFMVLVGPSGCGKSTTLRMIAGLEEITSGNILIDGRNVNNVLPKNRDIAMVFQNYALYPHMSVFDNMAFGLRLKGASQDEMQSRVLDAAHILGIEELLERRPKALSGGQRQRVAVGRAIVRNPKVFLFDEPLSNLDAKMRVSMRTEISKLHARLATTMIYVTHDQVEAMTMGDRITVMKDGCIMQVADPLRLYNSPDNMFVAGFIGSPPMNFFHGEVVREDGDLIFVENNRQREPMRIVLSGKLSGAGSESVGRRVVLGIRPEDIKALHTVASPVSGQTTEAVVEVSEPMGAETFIYLDTGGHSFVARVGSGESYEINEKLKVHLDLEKTHLFDAESELVIRA